jgi:uncharacterized protein
MTGQLQPVAPEERISALDVLRGWALFGVLLSNINVDYGATRSTALDQGFWWAQGWLIQNRFYTLLALLFGIGFGIQLLRASERGTDLRTTYYRRSLALLALGVVHGALIWDGDILTAYALAAFILVPFRTLSPRGTWIAAVLVWWLGPTVFGFLWNGLYVSHRYPVPGPWSPANPWLYAHGSWLRIEQNRFAVFTWRLGAQYGLLTGNLGLFLAGLWSVKSGYLRRMIEERRATLQLLTWALGAVAIGLARNLWLAKHGNAPQLAGVEQFGLSLLFRATGLLDIGTSLSYTAIILLTAQTAFGARFLRPLAATGRMALTTYLTQSVVCTLLFYGYGFGLLGRVSLTGMFVVTILIYSSQVAASGWWLRRFRFGPAEGLWRALTYGRVPEMAIHHSVRVTQADSATN